MLIAKKTYTYAEYTEIAARPENAGRLLELIDGEIIEKVGSFIPSMIAGLILAAFVNFLKTNPIGYVTGADGGYVLDDENTPLPDVGYISKVRMPELPAREVPVPPDLAVEVKSANDSYKGLQRKARKYLKAGTRVVWIVYPEDRTVDVCQPDENEPDGMRIREIGIDGTLDGGDVLPGFTLAVRDIFPA
ncbi:MAG: Uma2 family endonuclease [Anaerolineae bacterium]